VHLIAGFQSQIAALGGVMEVVRLARQQGAAVGGAALARRDTERAIHVDPLRGFAMPAHVLQTLDSVVETSTGRPTLDAGETALVVSLLDVPGDGLSFIADRTLVVDHGALWVTTA
jgi:hypothetical protein